MPDMATAPDDHVISDAAERLNDIPLEYQTVFPNIVCVYMTIRVDKTGEGVAAGLPFEIAVAPNRVHPAISKGAKQSDLFWREFLFEIFPGYQRNTIKVICI